MEKHGFTIKALDLSTFERARFRQDRKIGKQRWVVRTYVAPA
jgi:hypothetical protein